MARTPKISESDKNAFLEAIQGTTPLSHDKIILKQKTSIAPSPNDLSSFFVPESQIRLEDEQTEFLIQANDSLIYKQVAISAKILRKLRKGQYNIDAVLDLHGMIVSDARVAVSHFLQECLKAGLKVVIIIHGKGRFSTLPTLKNKLDQWLRKLDCVLAFCSALPQHGGKGAVYVLLKQAQEEKFV